MTKKSIIITIVVLIIGLIIFYISTFNKKMSKDEFIELMKSFKNVSNAKIESSIETKYIKGDNSVSIRKDGVLTWVNSKDKKCISWSPENRTYSNLEYVEDITGLEDAEYNFCGFENLNGTKCAVAEFKLSDVNLITKIWLDTKNGAVLKTVNKGKNELNEEYEITEEYTVTYNVVNDSDVEKPSLEGYTKV